MMTDVITCKDAYQRAAWANIPLEIIMAITSAVEKGKYWIDVDKKTDENGKYEELDESIVNALKTLGYSVHWTDSTFLSSYRISWE